MTEQVSIGVIGSGAWGTALAIRHADAGRKVTLWARRPELAAEMQASRANQAYLPDVKFPEALQITSDLKALDACDVWLLVTPAQSCRNMISTLRDTGMKPRPLMLCCKGIETGTGLLLADIIRQEWPELPVGLMTGPTFAADISRGLPSGMTISCDDTALLNELQEKLNLKNLRLYQTTDMKGAECAGALKNVMAIACGIVQGLQLGESARAALVTRGLAEIARMAVHMGGERETLMGLCGIGDLMLTCSSTKSRNFSLGLRLGQGEKMADILANRSDVTEGVTTAKAAYEIASRENIYMPITEAVYDCLYEGQDVQAAMHNLLNRPSSREERY